MVKVAFCDDDICTLDRLCILMKQYCEDHNKKIDYKAFHSPLELLFEIERGVRFDVLFLDILMPGENGIHTAQEIREYDSSVKIIFLTSSSEFAVQSYTVDAYYYQLKPIDEENFPRLMDSVLTACEKEETDSLTLQCKNGVTRIRLCDLEYCEIIHRTLQFHLKNGSVYESVGSLDSLSRRLEPYGGFLRVHRSFLINLEYVQDISYKAVTMSCLTKIPIPRGKYKELKDAFLEYAFVHRQMLI